MSYQTLDNILIDAVTYEAFEELARARCVPPQVLVRLLITEAVSRRSPTRGIALIDGLPRRARRHAEPQNEDEDEVIVPPDPNDETVATRLLRRVRSQPI
ncbi:hypothetical protein [Paraburkholderia sediminicola]|uniref:hypothetical protein n=1 Tax=Paraburkholderia sediminicola TaxID=458836 RepID=UPI0038BD2DEE